MSAKIDRCVFRWEVSRNEFTLFYFACLLGLQNIPTNKLCLLENIDLNKWLLIYILMKSYLHVFALLPGKKLCIEIVYSIDSL